MKRGAARRLRDLVVENFWWKVLSLAIAVVIWAMVASEPELSTLTTVRVEFKNLPDDLEISSEPVSTVTLELSGPSGELHSVAGDVRPSVVLDFSGAQPGEHTYTIGNGTVRLARGIRLVRSIPSEVRFTFEPRLTRNVPVEVRFTGQGQNEYELASSQVTPRELPVVGPRSRVSRLASVVTDQIDLSNVVGSAKFNVNVSVEDPYVRLDSPSRVTVQVTMRKKQQ